MAQPLYSTSVQISQFRGLNQAGDGYNLNMQYAREAENVNVTGGSFQPMRKGIRLPETLDGPIGTLAYVYRRYSGDVGTYLLVAISRDAEGNTGVYTKKLDSSDAWVKKYPGAGETSDITVTDCDWVTYEISLYPEYSASKTYAAGERVRHTDNAEADPVVWKNYKAKAAITTAESWTAGHWQEIEGSDPVDILLFTNAKDGMFCLYGDDQSVVPVNIQPDPGKPPVKFGVIARYNERIWGTAIDGDPDKLMYSVPYDPFDWAKNEEIPEDGAGDILQPTWDGDSFQSLRQYGSYLIAVKKNSIWRIYGTNPAEFTMQMQYGSGTIQENTLSIYNDYAFMLGEKGPMRYTGEGVYPFLQDATQILMHDLVNRNAIGKACAAMRGNTWCLALPINGSERCNAVLEYNADERSLAMRTGISVDAFMEVNQRLFYTTDSFPGYVFEMRDDVGETLPCKWVSGWQDLGLKSSIKSAFMVYMMIESEAPVELRLGIETEKKLKQKVVYTKPGKMLRKRLNLQGREFRLEIESYSAVPFTIAGGIKIDLELDPD